MKNNASAHTLVRVACQWLQLQWWSMQNERSSCIVDINQQSKFFLFRLSVDFCFVFVYKRSIWKWYRTDEDAAKDDSAPLPSTKLWEMTDRRPINAMEQIPTSLITFDWPTVHSVHTFWISSNWRAVTKYGFAMWSFRKVCERKTSFSPRQPPLAAPFAWNGVCDRRWDSVEILLLPYI